MMAARLEGCQVGEQRGQRKPLRARVKYRYREEKKLAHLDGGGWRKELVEGKGSRCQGE